jgi:hypothetical protein
MRTLPPLGCTTDESTDRKIPRRLKWRIEAPLPYRLPLFPRNGDHAVCIERRVAGEGADDGRT